jgi:uncharacterized NAD(P)/FAD-binding protein YdhS
MSATIAIVGAGFSGTLVALHLLRRSPEWVRIVLIERNAQFGKGQAYGTGNASHLLNVPAGRMSAFHDRPGDFIDYLRRQHDAIGSAGCGPCPEGDTFVPRRDFGAYVRHLLNEEIKQPASGDRLDLVRGDVRDIDAGRAPLRLTLDRDRAIEADMVVLALGNFPPEPPTVETPEFYDTSFYRPDPWSADALVGLSPSDPVLLIGTGLTTVDAVVSLLDAGHTGTIHAVSRRGLLPHRHGAHAGARPAEPLSYPTSITSLARLLRRETSAMVEAGADWHPAVDALRPFTTDVWQAMAVEDRRRFLRHVRPWWDIHRHRLPPSVADRIETARTSGQLVVRAGRMRRFELVDGQVRVTFRSRGKNDRLETIEVARVVNCAGPGADYDRIAHPLARALLKRGVVRPDPLRLGLDVTGTCALIDQGGAISRRLFAVGPVTKGQFWEMTAVPDIRRQCEVVAAHLASLVRPVAKVA